MTPTVLANGRILVVPRVTIPAGAPIYEPRGASLDLFHCRADEVVIYGPAGTGKTRSLLEKLNLCAELYPNIRGLLVRKTRSALTQTAMVTFEDEVIHPGQGVAFHAGNQEYRYPNGSVVVVGGLDDPDKVMSGQYDLIVAPECTQLSEDDWVALTSRLRNNRMPYQQLAGDCNPRRRHWLWKRHKRGDLLMFRSRHEDNPSVTGAYLNVLSKLRGARGQSLWLGEWGGAGEGVHYLDAVLAMPLHELEEETFG